VASSTMHRCRVVAAGAFASAAGTFVLAFGPVAALARPANSLHVQLSPRHSADRTGGGHDGA
jgi:hypothetical protein